MHRASLKYGRDEVERSIIARLTPENCTDAWQLGDSLHLTRLAEAGRTLAMAKTPADLDLSLAPCNELCDRAGRYARAQIRVRTASHLVR